MADVQLPFDRGSTMFGGAPDVSTDGTRILGQVYEVADTYRGGTIKLRAVRNASGAAILPRRACQLSADGKTVVGYSYAGGDRNVKPADELLPTAGVAANDIFYVVVSGLALGITALANYSVDIAAGDLLNTLAGTTAGATTAGRVNVRTLQAATANATAGERNATENDGVFARAVSASATSSTNASVLMWVFEGR